MSGAHENAVAPESAKSRRSTATWRDHSWRRVRYVLLAALLIVGLILVAYFYRECVFVTTHAANGDIGTKLTCEPATVTSAPFLVFLLVVISLLWPDLAEVTVLGVGLKRQADAARTAAEAAQQQVALLEQSIQVQSLRIQAMTTSSASNYTVLSVDGRFLTAKRAEEIRDLAAQEVANEGVPPDASSQQSEVSDDALKLTILSSWERLGTLLGLSRWKGRESDLEPPVVSDDEHLRNLIDEFVQDHERSIRLTRNLRNSIAHARPVDRETLVAGAGLLSELVRSAEDQLGIVAPSS